MEDLSVDAIKQFFTAMPIQITVSWDKAPGSIFQFSDFPLTLHGETLHTRVISFIAKLILGELGIKSINCIQIAQDRQGFCQHGSEFPGTIKGTAPCRISMAPYSVYSKLIFSPFYINAYEGHILRLQPGDLPRYS